MEALTPREAKKFKIEVRFSMEPMASDEDFEGLIERALEELEAFDEVLQADATASKTNGWVDIELLMAFSAPMTIPDMMQQAFAVFRTSLHAVGIGTPDWPDRNKFSAHWRTSGVRSEEYVSA